MTEILKRTALFDTHKKLGAKTVPFGGWDMPVWYTSVKDEHATVRNAAGLFDVSHMGVLEASGPNACAFLDTVSTNDVSKLAIGRSQYSYLLDDQSNVIDDIMIYRLGITQYMIVVNASNNDKAWAWLTSLNGSRAPQCILRDLRAESTGDERRVDIALQGPKSLEILQSLNPQLTSLNNLPYTGVLHAGISDIDVIISRTGYTGERVAYELFVHPDQSVALWNKLMQANNALGLKPCGLAARDSLRIEAGLPLYGHELGGQLNLVPCQIGFDNFVKLSKTSDFIGKAAYTAKVAANNAKIVRFRMNDKGVRVSKLGDPVLDRRGRVIGTVTSCALDSNGFLLGLALVETAANAAEGATLNIIALPEKQPPLLTPFAAFGSRTLIPDTATVLSRFPPRKS